MNWSSTNQDYLGSKRENLWDTFNSTFFLIALTHELKQQHILLAGFQIAYRFEGKAEEPHLERTEAGTAKRPGKCRGHIL